MGTAGAVKGVEEVLVGGVEIRDGKEKCVDDAPAPIAGVGLFVGRVWEDGAVSR